MERFHQTDPGKKKNTVVTVVCTVNPEKPLCFIPSLELETQVKIVRVLTEDEMGHPEIGGAITWLKEVLEYTATGDKYH
ncbi:hypothetical protein P7K49_018088 [Saguinus oedipus]|uniref:Uncharacterized protein n=1 Tax=Saguinus oedipus TaxID=9490 RepID=A0ABQ9V4S8_SAGOE|nr:hypothetical protein P7K49_018088 [Saguinus oedipus]